MENRHSDRDAERRNQGKERDEAHHGRQLPNDAALRSGIGWSELSGIISG